ncbi:MAG: hypothetical protein ACLGSH_05600 [Acidobacteriota bacterium]
MRLAAAWALLAVPVLLNASLLAAQTTGPAQNKAPLAAQPKSPSGQHKPSPRRHRTVSHRHPASTHAKPAPAAALPAQVLPAAPPPPNWPIQQKPQPAKVVWDSRGLEIQASNSSLDQILHEVATDIGATVHGLSQDQRIFGTYGPGPARDVLSKLLDGSGLNILMVGDQGGGTPREIVLSTSGPAGAQPAGIPRPPVQDSYQEEPPPAQAYPQAPPRPVPIRNPFGNDGPRTPQEILQQQLQQRQEQVEQQREEQQNSQQ